LEALLRQEGILDDCPDSGVVRRNYDVEVVQLGDLGHFGQDTQAKDRSMWMAAPSWLDVILWGNHDRAVWDGRHHFGGYSKPFPETYDLIKQYQGEGKLRLAHEAHGFLLTHAGLHSAYKHNKAPQTGAADTVKWLLAHEAEDSQDPEFLAIRDNIGARRGGRATAGGILWRDASESLYPAYRQVFGHSAKDESATRAYQSKGVGDSYCIDVGNKYNGRLKGIWLPECRVVEIKLERDQATQDFEDAVRKRLAARWGEDDFWSEDGPWRQLIT
jgi:hypothetical protein